MCFRPDVGYVQGMSYLAAMLLLFIPSELQAFQCLTSLLSRHICFDLFRLDREQVCVEMIAAELGPCVAPTPIAVYPQLNSHIRVFDKLFQDLVPDLFEHFNRIELKTDMFLVEWILTLFTRVLPLDVVARVWDAFLVLDEVSSRPLPSLLVYGISTGVFHCLSFIAQAFLMQTALGVLSSLRPELLAAELGECIQILRQVPSFRDPETLFHDICMVEVPHKLYQHLVAQELNVSRRQSAGGLLV